MQLRAWREPSFSPDSAAAVYVLTGATAQQMAVTFLLMGVGIFLLQMSRLVGDRTLRDISFGRYHRSRSDLFAASVGPDPGSLSAAWRDGRRQLSTSLELV
jgi:hypothetical protein